MINESARKLCSQAGIELVAPESAVRRATDCAMEPQDLIDQADFLTF